QHLGLAHALPLELGGHGGGVGTVLRAEAAVAPAGERRAEGAAAGLRDRAQALRAVGDGHADVAALLALDAHAVRWDLGTAALQLGGEDLEELAPVDRAAAELEVDRY